MIKYISAIERRAWMLNRFRYVHKQRYKIKDAGFSLVSQNCIGGILYSDMGLQFNSPTVNTLIRGESYLRFVNDIDKYIAITPVAAPGEDLANGKPALLLGDITVCCPHSESTDKALVDWERRAKRFDGRDMRLIATTWDLEENRGLIHRFLSLPYRKVLFTCDNSISGSDVFNLDANRYRSIDGFRQDNTFNVMARIPWSGKRVFEDCFDWVEWLNGKDASRCLL